MYREPAGEHSGSKVTIVIGVVFYHFTTLSRCSPLPAFILQPLAAASRQAFRFLKTIPHRATR
jgi:hypothetical protein